MDEDISKTRSIVKEHEEKTEAIQRLREKTAGGKERRKWKEPERRVERGSCPRTQKGSWGRTVQGNARERDRRLLQE